MQLEILSDPLKELCLTECQFVSALRSIFLGGDVFTRISASFRCRSHLPKLYSVPALFNAAIRDRPQYDDWDTTRAFNSCPLSPSRVGEK
jgi:hypothetical protein